MSNILRIYGLDPDVIKPGIKPIRDLIAHSLVAQGHQRRSDRPKRNTISARMSEIRRGESPGRSGCLTRKDSHTIIQAISSPGMPDGGWVTACTTTSPTGCVRRRCSSSKICLLDAALENMAHGLCVL